MSTEHKKDWSEDQQLTAYAFGELEGAELAEFEARIAGDAEAQALVSELRALGASLEQELAGEEQPGLQAEQRAAIEEQLGTTSELQPARRRVGAVGWLAMAAGLAGLCFGLDRYLELGAFGKPSPSLGLDLSDGSSITYKIDPRSLTIARNNSLKDLGALGYADARLSSPALEGERLITLGYSGGTPIKDQMRALGYSDGADSDELSLQLSHSEFILGELSPEDRQALQQLGYGGNDGTDEDESGGSDVKDQPTESNREAYERIYENPFQRVTEEPRSTFSIDVDTASYANMRRFLESGSLPPADAVRIEELINYFSYDYPEPTGAHPFSVNTEVGSAPWAPAHRLVRIGLQTNKTLPADRRGSNLVFLLDVSGSMNSQNKLPLLKQALHMLVQQLDKRDTISIVVYAGASGLALPATRCDMSGNIHMALERLQSGGSTNGGAGIELAYQIAQQNYIDGGINRVILGTDGDFNVGVSSNGDLTRLIEKKAKSGVFLTVLGFGSGNLQDSKMEQLADKGNGNYAYIDSVMEARKVLVEEMGATLETVAKDVKIQVEFNPTLVQAYRLLGYENRMLATRDFNDDTKDAGEIGAGHSVTALYEVVPVGVDMQLPATDPLRYQRPAQADNHAFSGELMNVALRYKQPDSDTSTLLSTPVPDSNTGFHELSSDTRWAASIAAFGMLLRDSKHKGTASMQDVTQWAAESMGTDVGGYRAQFIGLASKARQMMAAK